MSRRKSRKLRKPKQNWKNRKEDKSKIISSVQEESVVGKCPSETRVCELESQSHKCAKTSKSTVRKEKSSRQVHFSVLPDKYEPLEEDTSSNPSTEETQSEKQAKYKRFRKNFGKALRYTWKCLVVGLQSFSTSYSGPLSAASTFVPEIQRASPRA